MNIFDFKDSIYGERVEIEWYEFLRAEKKFDGIDSLIAQINADKAQAIEILNHIHLD